MAAATQQVGAAVHPLPLPSPTLTNPDMILPDCDPGRESPSPTFRSQRPPSPSALIRQLTPPQQHVHHVQLERPPPGRRSASPRVISPAVSKRPSFATLPNISETELTPKKEAPYNDAIASSPTLRNTPSVSTIDTWRTATGRKASVDSDSPHSDEMETNQWQGFDFGGQEAQTEEQEDLDRVGPLPQIANVEDDVENDQWMENDEDDDADAFGHNALSRRAEMILANAKKRLSVSLLPPQKKQPD
jgi:hypothetical protein